MSDNNSENSATAAPPQPVVVTFREVEKVLTGQEAIGNITEAAHKDPEATPMERAAVMAAMGNVLNELRRAEEKAGALVLTTPHHGPATRLQSLITSGEAANLKFAPLPSGGLEAKFDTDDWFGWASVAWEKLKHLTPHDMVRPKSKHAEPFPQQGRVGVLGDWGTGLYGAPKVADSIRHDPQPFAMLLHLGDTYYSGTAKEMKERFLGMWPSRNGAVNRALNSNHDMYSGGDSYFGDVLPAFGQEGSYFACQNKNWTLVGLDVAYKDHDIDDEQVTWLKQIIAQAGDNKIILFSHHQLYSHFEKQGSKLWSHPEFNAILRSGKIFAWYWGHEHRCSIFEGRDKNFGILARCIGNSGMPDSRDPTRNLPQASEPVYNRAEWRRSRAQNKEGNLLPDVVVLEGRNEYIKGEEDKFSPHGYAVLNFDGPSLTEQVLNPKGQVIYEKKLV
jgi:Calcineurin-like phosphoesterase